MDLNTEKNERLKLCTTICRLEDELDQLRRQEPSSSSLPVPFTINPPSSGAFQDSGILGSIQILKPRVTIILKRPSSTPSRSQPTEPPRSPLSNQTTSGPSLDLETRVRQLEEEITKARKVVRQLHLFSDLKLPSSMIEIELWSLETLTLSS